MHKHQAHPQTGKQIEVMDELDELPVGNHFAAKCNHESLVAKSVDIGRYRAEPGYERGIEFHDSSGYVWN